MGHDVHLAQVGQIIKVNGRVVFLAKIFTRSEKKEEKRTDGKTLNHRRRRDVNSPFFDQGSTADASLEITMYDLTTKRFRSLLDEIVGKTLVPSLTLYAIYQSQETECRRNVNGFVLNGCDNAADNLGCLCTTKDC
jgi:hypothetical protein